MYENLVTELSDQLKHKIVKKKGEIQSKGALAILKGDEKAKEKADKHMNTISKIENEPICQSPNCLHDFKDHISHLKKHHGIKDEDLIKHITSGN